MKSNNAPEKLYLHPTEKNNIGASWLAFPLTDNDIEYVRKDAFIEKAVDWLNNFYNEDTHSYLIDEDIEKFIKYMKGK